MTPPARDPGPVGATAYLYPWDVVGDPAAAERTARLGVGTVALAAAYHSVRAATPRHPDHRVVSARHAALYVPIRPDRWRGSPLVPPSGAEWSGGTDSFGAARDALRGHGLAVDAWTVLTHSSVLGTAHPDLAVRNAFGDRYAYALCPTSAVVREYAVRVVREVLDLGRPDGLVVEACGPLGFGHQSMHEKTDGADWSPVDQALLSVCFCAACRRELAWSGTDPGDAAAAVRDAVGTGAASPDEALGGAGGPLLAVRSAAVTALRDEVATTARAAGVGRLSFFASADPWSTGPSAAVLGPGADADAYLAGCWGPAVEGAAAVRALRAATRPPKGAAGPGPRVGAYVTVLPPHPADPEQLGGHWAALRAAGADDLHIYHAGLASTARLDAAAAALAALSP
ncbi:hypothetical protein CLV63_107193 [Murinocardiopsis flavida]|uniref:Alanine-rich protein n=1 Tax=Murinocardiopsis flavida TaxID=645275 RepID=A0A2P8DKQ2_9ACTN|nr:hypothetical protein [Murinocardiopsis flavida]PSK97800.1 hypothetical protein CLV63_107193 [Murinocardiopsis flavida]